MKNIYSIILVFFSLCIASCDDAKDSFNEWDANYVYLQRDHHWEMPSSFIFKHTPAGIEGNNAVSQSFRVKFVSSVGKDVTIHLAVKSDVIPDGYIQLSTNDIMIKAGEKLSEEVTVSLSDLSFMSGTEEEMTYDFSVFIESVETQGEDICISKQQNTFKMFLKKKAYSAFETSGVPAGEKVADRSAWEITLGSGVVGQPENIIDVSTYGTPNYNTNITHPDGFLEFEVDFQKAYVVTGLSIHYRAASYSPNSFELFESEDGSSWKSIGVLKYKVTSTLLNVKFLSPTETRYLKYKVLEGNSGGAVSITNFEVYKKKD